MANKIQLRRGLKANIPTLDIGEPAFCTDTKEFYIGSKDGNARMSYDTGQGVVATDSDKLGGQLPSYYAKQSDITYKTAGGTATALTLDTGTLIDGYSVTFIASANNNGTATTVNSKNLYKPNTTTAPNLTAGKAYTVWYNKSKDCFFIKASAEGTVTADKVLANETFSNDNDTGIKGTMPNNPADLIINDYGVWNDSSNPSETSLAVHLNEGAYLNKNATTGKPHIQIPEPNLISANILKGKCIFKVEGSIDLTNLKSENVKKDVNINGTIGSLEERFSSFECMKNLSTDYLLLAVINNQYYCYKPSTQKTCYILNTDGTVLKTITNSDAAYSPFLVTKDYIFWSDAGSFIISDLNGVTLKRITSTYTAITEIKINNQYLVFDNSMYISLFDSNFNLIRQYNGSNSSVIGVFNKDDICIYLKESSNTISVYYLDINSANGPKQIGRSGLTNVLQFLNS